LRLAQIFRPTGCLPNRCSRNRCSRNRCSRNRCSRNRCSRNRCSQNRYFQTHLPPVVTRVQSRCYSWGFPDRRIDLLRGSTTRSLGMRRYRLNRSRGHMPRRSLVAQCHRQHSDLDRHRGRSQFQLPDIPPGLPTDLRRDTGRVSATLKVLWSDLSIARTVTDCAV